MTMMSDKMDRIVHMVLRPPLWLERHKGTGLESGYYGVHVYTTVVLFTNLGDRRFRA